MKSMLKVFAAFLLLFLIACGGNTPSDVAEQAYSYMKDGEYAKCVELMYSDTENADEYEAGAKMMEGLLQASYEKIKAKNGGIKSYEVVSEDLSEDGEEAVVSMKVTYEDNSVEDEDMKLKKNKDGDWKLYMGK